MGFFWANVYLLMFTTLELQQKWEKRLQWIKTVEFVLLLCWSPPPPTSPFPPLPKAAVEKGPGPGCWWRAWGNRNHSGTFCSFPCRPATVWMSRPYLEFPEIFRSFTQFGTFQHGILECHLLWVVTVGGVPVGDKGNLDLFSAVLPLCYCVFSRSYLYVG